MNKSGDSVAALLHFYKIPIENLIVIQDDIDQPFGKMRFHKNRGHGGHNGIRDISEKLGSPDYIRLKLGVGRPAIPQMNVADWVLQNFSNDEMIQMNEFINKSLNAIEAVIFDGLSKASTQFN
jgi:PTH1 family peptidyl-tRNA hydrolase